RPHPHRSLRDARRGQLADVHRPGPGRRPLLRSASGAGTVLGQLGRPLPVHRAELDDERSGQRRQRPDPRHPPLGRAPAPRGPHQAHSPGPNPDRRRLRPLQLLRRGLRLVRVLSSPLTLAEGHGRTLPMRRALLLTLASATASLVIGAAALAQQEDEAAPAAQPTPPAELSAEDRARRAKVVAKVGDATITVGDVEDAVNQQSPFLRVRYRDRAKLRELVEGMVRFELLAREAERAEMDDDPEVVRVAKQNAVQQLIRRDFDERITPESIPEADVRAYYD